MSVLFAQSQHRFNANSTTLLYLASEVSSGQTKNWTFFKLPHHHQLHHYWPLYFCNVLQPRSSNGNEQQNEYVLFRPLKNFPFGKSHFKGSGSHWVGSWCLFLVAVWCIFTLVAVAVRLWCSPWWQWHWDVLLPWWQWQSRLYHQLFCS